MRSATAPDWQNDAAKFQVVAMTSLELIDTYLAQDDAKRSIFSAKLHLRGILKKAEENFGSTETYEKLLLAMAKLENKEKELK
jgi:hypothetical protein